MRWVASIVLLATAWHGPGPGRFATGQAAEPARPNIVLIVLDDLGFSDLGCYGGEIQTPNIDRLAAEGVRFTRFTNAARCCPTRASLLTGLYAHQVGLGRNGRSLNHQGATIAELLGSAGYRTAMVGKWHLSETRPLGGRANGPAHMAWLNHQADPERPFADLASYPVRRGFERHYGPIWGVVDYFDPFSLVDGTEPVRSVPPGYYLTDAITSRSVADIRDLARDDRPFFLYIAHCAPHWPLHARAEDIAQYRETYREGWQAIRESRYRRLQSLGLIDRATHPLPPLTGPGPDWATLDESSQQQEAAVMATHAAMVHRVDQGVGQILQALRETGRDRNTAIFVLADNGASPERYLDPGFDRPSTTRDGRPIQYQGRFEPGAEATWGYLGPSWASASNTPYRFAKAESFEGGIHTPMIVRWPDGPIADRGSLRPHLGHVIDVLPTCLDLAGVTYPDRFADHALLPLEGTSLVPALRGNPGVRAGALYFEHEGGRAVIADDWKAVARAGQPWELYHLAVDATETRNMSASEPERLANLTRLWHSWAARVGAPLPAPSIGPSTRPGG